MRLFGLIGYPLGHSFSVGYFTEKFRNENIRECNYRNFPIDSIEKLPGIIEKEKELAGLNVTIPYKEKVLKYLDEIDDTADQIGAVNTIKIFRGRASSEQYLKGYNTDEYGFLASLKSIPGYDVEKALILGTGGASLAVIYALQRLGVKSAVVSRNPASDQLSYRDLNKKIMDEYKLIINTTPLGTYPDVDQAPDIPYSLLNESHILHDLVYNPPETLFMKIGRERGARVKNGYQMLAEQAERSWQIWNE